jgi:NTE family protein
VTAIDLPRPVGFVLGGGGSLGAMQAGMLRAVAEVGLRPDVVIGTSVGALNGALLADDPEGAVDRLAELWPTVRREHVFPGKRWKQFSTLRSARTFIFDSGALADFATEHLRASTFDQLQLPFGAVATDAETAEPIVLTTGLVVPAIVASTAIPGVYPPVWHNGRTLYDGGVVANVPMRQTLAMGARSLVVFDCSYPGQSWDPPDTMADVLAWVLSVSARQQAAVQLPSIVKEVPVVYLPGPARRRISPLDFNHTQELINETYEACRAFLADLEVDGKGLYGSLDAPRTRIE